MARSVLLLLLATLSLPLLRDMNRFPDTLDPDALQSLSFAYSFSDAVRTHGEYPLWNPYFGGGIRWAGYPYNPGLTPMGALLALAGHLHGTKLLIIGALVLGGLGMYGAGRAVIRLTPFESLVAASLYASALWFPGRLASGNYAELMAFTWPFALLCFHRLREGHWLGLLLPIWFMQASPQLKYHVPFVVAAGVVVVLTNSGYRDERLRGLLLWLGSLVVGVALALPSLLPLVHVMAQDLVDQSQYQVGYSYSYVTLGSSLLAFRGLPELEAHHIIGVGVAALAAATAGLVFGWRRVPAWVVIFSLGVWLSLGDRPIIPLTAVFRHLPLLSTMSSYAKYANLYIFTAVCVLAAVGFHALWTQLQRWGERRAQIVVGVVLLGTVALPFQSAWRSIDRTFVLDAPAYPSQDFHHVAWEPHWGVVDRYRFPPQSIPAANQYHNIRRSIGTITWYGNFVFPEHATPKWLIAHDGRTRTVNPADQGMVWVAGASAVGQLRSHTHVGRALGSLTVTYNTLRFAYRANRPERAVLNFNYDPNWESSLGTVVEHEGLLAVDLPATGVETEVSLRFRDPSVTIGIWVAVLVGLGTGVAFVRWRPTV